MDERKYIHVVSRFIRDVIIHRVALDDYELRYVCRHSARKLYKISKGFHSHTYTSDLLYVYIHILYMYIYAIRRQ